MSDLGTPGNPIGAHIGDAFETWYANAGLPEGDRDAWVDVLLAYPRNRDHQRAWPTEDDHAAASAAFKAARRERRHDEVSAYAWRLAVERQGTRLLDRQDAMEVANYVQYGGTLEEARAYLTAMGDARSPESDLWSVWARHEVAFDATRIQLLREMRVSPEDVAWYVARTGWRSVWDVQRIHAWQRDHCPDALWRVAAAYRLHEVPDTDVPAWEDRRRTGEDVLRSLDVIAALARGV